MEKVPAPKKARFEKLRRLNLKTLRAWAIKETLRALWTYRSKTSAKNFFNKRHGWAARSRLEPIQEVTRMIKRKPCRIS